MARLTAPEIYSLALGAGFPIEVGSSEQTAVVMTAIAYAESTGDPGAVNPVSGATGLWQINPHAWPAFDWSRMKDPRYNAAAAKQVYDRQGFNAWTTYKNGRYKKWLPLARGGASGVDHPIEGTTTAEAAAQAAGYVAKELNPAQALQNLVETIQTTVETVLDVGFWKRAGIMALGWWLVIAGLVIVFRDLLSPAAKTALAASTGGASVAVEAAAETAADGMKSDAPPKESES